MQLSCLLPVGGRVGHRSALPAGHGRPNSALQLLDHVLQLLWQGPDHDHAGSAHPRPRTSSSFTLTARSATRFGALPHWPADGDGPLVELVAKSLGLLHPPALAQVADPRSDLVRLFPAAHGAVARIVRGSAAPAALLCSLPGMAGTRRSTASARRPTARERRSRLLQHPLRQFGRHGHHVPARKAALFADSAMLAGHQVLRLQPLGPAHAPIYAEAQLEPHLQSLAVDEHHAAHLDLQLLVEAPTIIRHGHSPTEKCRHPSRSRWRHTSRQGSGLSSRALASCSSRMAR